MFKDQTKSHFIVEFHLVKAQFYFIFNDYFLYFGETHEVILHIDFSLQKILSEILLLHIQPTFFFLSTTCYFRNKEIGLSKGKELHQGQLTGHYKAIQYIFSIFSSFSSL